MHLTFPGHARTRGGWVGAGGGVWGCILGVRMHPLLGKLFQNHKIMQELGISAETEFTSLMLPSK